jgi:hypothetical protein
MPPLNRQIHLVVLLMAGVASSAGAQGCDRVRPARVAVVTGSFAAVTTGVVLSQHDSWWTTPRTAFHFADLPSANAGQDYLLHGATAYHVSQIGALGLRWACVPEGTAAWLGAAMGVAFALPKEVGDGLHEEKGFSLRDLGATAAGAVLPALHRTLPKTQLVQLEVWYWPSNEWRTRTGPEPSLATDYAGQRYFLTFNPGRLPGGAGRWPDWLGVAVGHGIPHWASEPPEHQWFIGLDLDLGGLPVRTRWWRTLATAIDQVHLPAPGIRLSEGKIQVGVF